MKEFWKEFREMNHRFLVAITLISGTFTLAHLVQKIIIDYGGDEGWAGVAWIVTCIYVGRKVCYKTKFNYERKTND
jgi:hypothetical protein